MFIITKLRFLEVQKNETLCIVMVKYTSNIQETKEKKVESIFPTAPERVNSTLRNCSPLRSSLQPSQMRCYDDDVINVSGTLAGVTHKNNSGEAFGDPQLLSYRSILPFFFFLDSLGRAPRVCTSSRETQLSDVSSLIHLFDATLSSASHSLMMNYCRSASTHNFARKFRWYVHRLECT